MDVVLIFFCFCFCFYSDGLPATKNKPKMMPVQNANNLRGLKQLITSTNAATTDQVVPKPVSQGPWGCTSVAKNNPSPPHTIIGEN